MPPIITLDRLERGIPAVVDALRTQGAMRRRLMDIGLTPGTEVCALYRSCSGDPTAYGFRGAVIALRREDAKTVLVRARG